MFRLRGEISTRRALLHCLAQVLGAVAGAMAFHAMFGFPLIQMATTARSGAGLWLSEFLATGALVLVISGALAARPALVPLLVGLLTMAGYWFFASTGFTNPAITLARAISNTAGGMQPGDIPAYVAVQIAAVVLATPLAKWLFNPRN
jgi:glycerol uptake facilitator-like aquaporin